MISKTLAHYEIEDRLGEGGSGVVYRGRDLRLERPVAIKVLADALRDDELAWARLLREARLASQLNHPHIAAIYDLGEEDGRAYIVMEYVEGLPLADLIPEGGIPFEQVKSYARQISDALDFAHQQGVIHGDLKGSNIIVTPEGNIKLLDFGLGRRIPRHGMAEVTNSHLPLVEGGTTAGTLPYLAPEVLRGGPTSLQSDVWALGVLLYQMATGELPFGGATPFELSMEIMVGTPRELDKLPEPLRSTLRGCMAGNPQERPARPSDVASALAGLALGPPSAPPAHDEAGSGIATEQPTMLPAARRWRKWWVAGAAMALLVLLAGVYARHIWRLRHAAQPISQSNVLKNSAAGNPNVKVWVNTDSGTYHCPGARWYGKTRNGEYLTQKEAQEKGFHPAASRACL
jgi:serine/threonine-protein kinase